MKQALHRLTERTRPWFAAMFLREMRRRARPMPVIDDRPLVVFSPHQDDETFGCGGLMALKRRRGAPVAVIYTTDGSQSLPGHPLLTPEKMVPIRRDEARAAVQELGVPPADVHFLDGPDGGLAGLPEDRSAALVEAMRGLLVRYRPGQICVPYRRDVHPDHEATYRMALAALQAAALPATVLEYLVWVMWFRRGREEARRLPVVQKLDLADVLPAKRRAIDCFATQVLPPPPWKHATLPAGFVPRFSGRWELYGVEEFTPPGGAARITSAAARSGP